MSADGSRLRAANRAQRCMWGKTPGLVGWEGQPWEECGFGLCGRKWRGRQQGLVTGRGRWPED